MHEDFRVYNSRQSVIPRIPLVLRFGFAQMAVEFGATLERRFEGVRIRQVTRYEDHLRDVAYNPLFPRAEDWFDIAVGGFRMPGGQ